MLTYIIIILKIAIAIANIVSAILQIAAMYQ